MAIFFWNLLTNVCVHTHGGIAHCRFVAGESNRDSLGNSLDVALLNCVLKIIHGPMLAITYTSLRFRCLAQKHMAQAQAHLPLEYLERYFL